MDGNNSLKRLATQGNRVAGDTRMFSSDYFLPREFVDQFANEVKTRQSQAKPDLNTDGDGLVDREADEEARPRDNEGDPTDGAPDASSGCANNWKAAAADAEKRMWGMFEETGIFACACRHGLVVYITDMVKSGER